MDACCLTWGELAEEIKEILEIKYAELIKKGIPKSALAANFYIIDHMTARCPCHSDAQIKNKDLENRAAKVKEIYTSKDTPIINPICPACEGTGKAGGDKKSSILCIICQGKGKKDSSNTPSVINPEIMDATLKLKDAHRDKPVDPKSLAGQYE